MTDPEFDPAATDAPSNDPEPNQSIDPGSSQAPPGFDPEPNQSIEHHTPVGPPEPNYSPAEPPAGRERLSESHGRSSEYPDGGMSGNSDGAGYSTSGHAGPNRSESSGGESESGNGGMSGNSGGAGYSASGQAPSQSESGGHAESAKKEDPGFFDKVVGVIEAIRNEYVRQVEDDIRREREQTARQRELTDEALRRLHLKGPADGGADQ
ncbi:hypothetical protein [Nocardia abscessus]|uniref:hypothetical protein n=1 Tax=Nocardia abscessus TaxID=120957 RepID=UPI00245374DA|nr:hypothetical protein [Nocardia abscessus]